ncbi:MAG: vitamin K epoxide reductase family protein [Patescibacteria group bacterium]|nr:vitamin K epoxide reductase family protein [Patescibacteria group bacterium]
MNTTRLLAVVQILAVAGIALALYILYEQVTPSATSICYINSTINCDSVISGATAKTFGIPTPLYGLVGYSLILAAAAFRKGAATLGVATFGLAFCLWIAYRDYLLHTICPTCIVCQVIMLTIFILAVKVVFISKTSEVPPLLH